MGRAKCQNLISAPFYRSFNMLNHELFILYDILSNQKTILGWFYLTSDEEKIGICKNSLWIQGEDTMDSCFIINFGFDPPLPWPQVLSRHMMFDDILLSIRLG